jgi:protein tyrosine/serine phosphatase
MGDRTEQTDRTLKVDGLVNGRDLGGLKRADGTVTPRGGFFRSENVDWITGNGWQQIYDAGIRSVVDLRQHGERNADSQGRPGWLTTIHIDLDGLENKGFWADYWDNGLVGTALYFLPHLLAMPERTAAAISALVNAPDGGVLFHCMGGRDRTGLISMVLLHAIGTDPECIVDDYLETVRLGDVRASSSKRNNAEPMLEELCRQHGTTTEGAFRDTLAKFDLQAFLDAAELTEEVREALFTWRGATTTSVASAK